MTDTPTVDQAWNAVMRDVQAIKKGDRNKQQGFNFRGIDAVMNAVGPVLREHGVAVTPHAEDIITSQYVTSGGTTMHSAIVKVRFVVRGPAGDNFDGCTYGEAADAGDKAVSKAHSVAYRTFLLQGLTIPTDEPDPDSESHQRAAAPPVPARVAEFRDRANGLTGPQRAELRARMTAAGLNGGDMTEAQAVEALSLLEEVGT